MNNLLKLVIVFFSLISQTTLIEAQTINDFPILKGEYLGQKPPGIIPEVFAPGIVSLDDWAEHCLVAVSPEGDEIFWSVYLEARKEGAGSNQQLFYSKLENGVWTKPKMPEFTKANRYGSNGGTDLYICFKSQDETWEYRVVRGGGWRDYSDYCRSDFRYPKHPNRGHPLIGFRVVKSL